MRTKKSKPWDDTDAMVEALEARRSAKLPIWSVYSYDDEAQYKSKLQWYVNELRTLSLTGSTLDIGCGSGGLLHLYRAPAGYLGLDLATGLLDEARSAFPQRAFVCGDVLSAPLTHFDTVVMIGLLGLSPDPLRLISRACDLTRGHLLFDFLEDQPSHVNSAVELRYVSRAAVASIVQGCGLDVVRTRQVGANLRIVAQRQLHH